MYVRILSLVKNLPTWVQTLFIATKARYISTPGKVEYVKEDWIVHGYTYHFVRLCDTDREDVGIGFYDSTGQLNTILFKDLDLSNNNSIDFLIHLSSNYFSTEGSHNFKTAKFTALKASIRVDIKSPLSILCTNVKKIENSIKFENDDVFVNYSTIIQNGSVTGLTSAKIIGYDNVTKKIFCLCKDLFVLLDDTSIVGNTIDELIAAKTKYKDTKMETSKASTQYTPNCEFLKEYGDIEMNDSLKTKLSIPNANIQEIVKTLPPHINLVGKIFRCVDYTICNLIADVVVQFYDDINFSTFVHISSPLMYMLVKGKDNTNLVLLFTIETGKNDTQYMPCYLLTQEDFELSLNQSAKKDINSPTTVAKRLMEFRKQHLLNEQLTTEISSTPVDDCVTKTEIDNKQQIEKPRVDLDPFSQYCIDL